jgi:hypothetical protein
VGLPGYLNPFRIRDAIRLGRPHRVRLVDVDGPRGLLIPRAQLTIEVEGRGGRTERFRPELPIPFFYGWGLRAVRPLLRRFRPREIASRTDAPVDRPTLEAGDADGRELKQATDRAQDELRRVGRD